MLRIYRMCWMVLCGLLAVALLEGSYPGKTATAKAGETSADATPQAVIYVSTLGNDSNDGLTWVTAKRTVQAGLNAATAGDQVWVAAGTYVENIVLVLGVELYGGFAGSETALSQRNWRTNLTILDGNQAGSVVAAPTGATASTRIDGFTIRNGDTVSGGGICCNYSSSPTISNNTITGNTATYGGGIDCYSYSSPTISNNTISGNIAFSGGGIDCSSYSSSSSPTISNNTITGNTASGDGGGICCSSSSPTITNNTFTGNTAPNGGGICCDSYSSPTISNNTITGNTASSGGGIYCSSSSPTISNNTISGNIASSGGGIYCGYSSSPTIANTIIAFNSSGINRSSGTPTLRYCCVYGNGAYNYSGLTDPTGTNGNISADPRLADVARGNVHLQPTSPCIDAGDDAAVQAGWTDIDGQARKQGAHADIGADESDGTLWPPAAAIVYVSPGGNDSNDGLSWASAKRTVQAAVDAGGTGSQVWVAAGTYVGTIRLGFGMALYGGFVGVETDLSWRDWRTNLTILDANQAGSVVTAPPAATASTRIDGFTIRNGKETYGGGIYCSCSSPTITNNTITGNNATSYGGGIYCSSSSPTITNNTITGNSDSGIYCYSSSPTITNNTISGNSGRGIGCDSSSSPTITNTIIAFNSSGIDCFSGTPTLRYCCVYGNGAYNYSGLTDPTGTNGNISADPQLADMARGNLHLQPTSPCIDAGDDAVVQAGWTDIDGQARVQGAHVDIGADESDGTIWPAAAAIVYVSPGGNDNNDGLSWASAKQTVQAAVDAGGTGSQVWVAAGTYIGTIRLGFGIALYGGFAGSETDLCQRNWRTNLTILDGNQAGSVVTAPLAAAASTRIDGLTIRNGKASNGGGIYCNSSSPTIANNTISGNTASNGGGIYCSSSSPTITNNTVTGNNATSSGGGIYCYSSSPTITNNTITGNTASSYGGGGICCGDSSSPTIANNTITGNTASGDGGGISCSSYSSSSSPTITNNTITGNTASGDGGGIYCYNYSSPTIANNTITGNIASSGGGIYCYSSSSSPSSPTITNTIIAFNSSGIYRSSRTPTLRYCCVYGNGAYNYSGLTDPTGTNGNISADPRLADVARGNVHLQPTSPCIDAGDDAAVQAGWTDIDGQARKQGAHVDIGADESDGTLWPPAAAIVYVSPGGNDNNDGLSWASAKQTVRAAVDAGGTGSQVWVAAGTYVGTIRLGFGIALYGGFAGSETDLSQRNWRTNLTILDGNQAGSVVTAPPAATASTRIDGFTIRNGKETYGGGIYCSCSSPTITNNTITGNNATSYGGGIYCSSSSPTIANNAISDNTASGDGGGIYCYYYSSPTISNNTITGNTASSSGGGIYCYYYSSPTISNNTIAGNTASYGGGIRCYIYSSPKINNNTITGNRASGGGIDCYSSSPTITNTIIAFNSSGVYSSSGAPTLRYCCVYGTYNFSGLTDPTNTNGNVSVDPLLVRLPNPGPDGIWGTADDDYGDLHLLAGSRCINAGDPAYVAAPGETDMDGQPRVIGGRIDIGADEFCLVGDANFDSYVNVGDLQLLVAAWGTQKGDPSYNPAADLNGDNAINAADLLLLVANWGQQLTN